MAAITRMQQKRGTAAEWYAENPVLADGEIGFERDTGILKVGNGVDSWVELVPIVQSVQAPTEAEWIANNPVLKSGEVGIARDTLTIKIGDGVKTWNQLPATEHSTFVTKAYADTYYAGRSETRSGAQTSAGLYRNETGATGQPNVFLVDDAAHNHHLLSLRHFADGLGSTSQTYAIDISNRPGAQSAFVIHQYSERSPGIQLDNCGNQTMMLFRNTQNLSLAPGTMGTGHYFQFNGDLGTVGAPNTREFGRLTKDMIFFNTEVSKPWQFQTAQNTHALKVERAGTGTTGSALNVVNSAPVNALALTQSGAKQALNINAVTGSAGFYIAEFNALDYGPRITTTSDGGRTLEVNKNGTGIGEAFRVTNLGTSHSISVRDGAGEKFAIASSGRPRWVSSSIAQETVGGAGGASALPAAPVVYLQVLGPNNATYVIPAYAAA